jgi:GT2 family glycosyltransferase
VLYRAEVFRQVGLLEESFESYLEDADFGLRCVAQGIFGRYVPEARAIHLGSAALGRWHPETVRRMARNQVLLAARHYGARHVWPVLAAQLLWGALAVRHGRGLAWARGKVQGLRLFSSARKERPGRQALPDGRGSDQSRDRQGALVLDQILRSNEQFIRTVSRDTYWRLYFLLTGGAK